MIPKMPVMRFPMRDSLRVLIMECLRPRWLQNKDLAHFCGQSEKLVAFFGDELLVGCDHSLPCLEGFGDVCLGWLNSAHHLNHNLN